VWVIQEFDHAIRLQVSLCHTVNICHADDSHRGLAGVAGGGITALSMIIVSDIVSLECRGKYQGILGSMVGIGNLIGPLIAAGLAEKASWRALFWMLAPLMAISCGICAYFLPGTTGTGNFRDNVRKIDYWGVLTASSGLILVLVPLSGAGSYFSWNSPMVISMMTIGAVLMVLFVIVEWKIARLPMMPMSIWRNRAVASILVQNFFFGIVFYGYMYFLPIYYQNVKEYSILKSGLLTIPLTVSQSVASICSGQYISRLKRYGELIYLGFALMTITVALSSFFNRTTPEWANILILVFMGIGQGNVFQPTLISLMAHSPKAQRAVVTSIRNFLRCLGGAVGLAVSAAILQNVLRENLPPQFASLSESSYAKPNFTLYSPEDANNILNAYEKASHAVFIFYAPVIAICLVCCVFVKDEGLQRKEEVETAQKKSSEDFPLGQNQDEEMGQSAFSLDSHLEKGDHLEKTESRSSIAESSLEHVAEKPKA
jgi:MFS family permease